MMELQPWAILPKGPEWTSAGWPSHGLHEVGHDGVSHDGHEGAGQAEVTDRYRVAAAAGADDDTRNARAQVIKVVCQRENGHDF